MCTTSYATVTPSVIGTLSRNGPKSGLMGHEKRVLGDAGEMLRVPSSHVPHDVGHRLAVVNKGKTADEEFAEIKINADVDVTMSELLDELQLQEPEAYSIDKDPILKAAKPVPDGEPSAPWRIGADH